MLRQWPEAIAEAAGGSRAPITSYGIPLAAVTVITAMMFPFRDVFGGANLSLLYVMLLFGIGLAFGTGPAIASALLAFLLSDFLFYPPYETLLIDKKEHVLGLLVLLGIATGAGVLASRLRSLADEARREARRAAMLYDLNRSLITDVTLDQVLTSIVRGVVEIYGAKASRLLVQGDGDHETLMAAATWPGTYHPTDSRETQHLVRLAVESGTITGIGAAGRRVMLPHGIDARMSKVMHRAGDDLLYVPVGTSEERIGVLEISGRPGGGRFASEDRRMLRSFADQAALAVERARLIEQVTQRRAFEQSSELKSALLAAVSHDLRTPLAAIKMSASALQDTAIDLDAEARTDLLGAIEESADWLAQVVDNLLDLSRIEGGALKPDRDWHDLSDLLQHVLVQMERTLAHHRVFLDIDEELPLVYMDYVQISQVMTNLLGNASKYSAPDTGIEIAAGLVDAGNVEIRVTDHGRGISRASLPHIFDTFYRVQDDGVRGSGLGLAICKGLVEAHGGTIQAESVVGQGTTMRVRLPVEPGEGEGAGA